MTATPITSGDGSALVWTAPGEIHDSGCAPPARREMGALPPSRFRRVTEYIGEHLDQDLTLVQLGAVVCMSPYHFARLFRRSAGVSPHRFVVRARIDRATTLLAAPELSIARISRVVGFRTPSHFSTVFRRITGITPRAYRAEYLRAGRPHGDGGRDELG
jgi:AraC-like DNA-binding protein